MLLPLDANLGALGEAHGGVSVVSYNVLVPNGGERWWVFKYYDPEVPDAQRAWPHRQSLLAGQLLGAAADVVCVQEAAAESFEADFSFLRSAGYEAALHGKSMLRPATFWRASRWALLHRRDTDKALAVILRSQQAPERTLGVVNVHLSAAPDPRRRFRQVFDALDRLQKDLRRLGVAPEQAAVVVCGDFNAAPEGSGTHHLLSGGVVDAGFREPAFPEVELSSKARQHGLPALREAYQEALGAPPVTHIVSEVAGLMRGGEPTPRLLAALGALFERYAGDAEFIDASALDAWILEINRAPDRGSERREALARMQDGRLSREGFLGVYRSALAQGKLWSAQHDLATCGLLPEGERRQQTASLDRLYYTAGPLTLAGVWDALPAARRAELARAGRGLPDAAWPSDHVALGAVLRWG